MIQTDQWNPDQYNKFREQRRQPFDDLVAFIRPLPRMRIIDLGCGTGDLTALLAERFDDATVEGIDSSASMIGQASADGRVTFRQQEIQSIEDFSPYDLIFSHAVFQWVPDNEGLMRRILSTMKHEAQLAIQMPRNEGHPSHQIAEAIAQEEPFRTLLHGYVRKSEVLQLEQYSQLLHEHRLRDLICIEKIYGHELPESRSVVEWVKGTSLSAYLSRLDQADQSAFLVEYSQRLLAAVGDRSPYYYPFRRMLIWGRRQ
ncbi:MAG: methyltransferase domain-containing protein [Dehalococcoidia bacterium]